MLDGALSVPTLPCSVCGAPRPDACRVCGAALCCEAHVLEDHRKSVVDDSVDITGMPALFPACRGGLHGDPLSCASHGGYQIDPATGFCPVCPGYWMQKAAGR